MRVRVIPKENAVWVQVQVQGPVTTTEVDGVCCQWPSVQCHRVFVSAQGPNVSARGIGEVQEFSPTFRQSFLRVRVVVFALWGSHVVVMNGRAVRSMVSVVLLLVPGVHHRLIDTIANNKAS